MQKKNPNSKEVSQIAEDLNTLLANYMVFYQNTRGFHWNIKGDKFFEMHAKFEELYNDLLLKIDEIAERILTLGKQPLHTFEDYITNAEIKPVKNVSDADKSVRSILSSFEILLGLQRSLLKKTEEADDEGTNAMMSDYIREQEKLIWMYNAYLGK